MNSNYYNKSEVNLIKSNLETVDTSLQGQINLVKTDIDDSYYTKLEVNGIKTNLETVDTSLQGKITLINTNFNTKLNIPNIQDSINIGALNMMADSNLRSMSKSGGGSMIELKATDVSIKGDFFNFRR